MSRVLRAAGFAALLAAPVGAWAQEPAAVPPPASAAAPATAPAVVPANTIVAGSPVIIEVTQAISSRTVKQGDMFPLRLASPLTLDGRVVVPAGATGEGQVVDAGRAGALGKPTKLVVAARYILVDGQKVQLRGFRLGAAGRDNSNAIMAASFVPYVGMLAMFAKGGEIDVPAGTLGQAKLVADLPAAAPAPSTPPASPAATSSQ
jgi:hypothetical protein